ncbi:MAG: hypothetical protein RL331_1863 [Bacteroidota bacterium]|jgi:hypothetical protein
MKHLITLTFLSIIGLTYAQIPSFIPSTGLVGWWPFNGNANDESGNGNNGTVSGAILSVDRNGDINKAYSFNNGVITVSNSFFNNGWQDYTLSVWANSIDVSQYAQNIYNTYPHDGEGFGLNHPNAPGKFSFWKNSNINVHAWDIFSANPWNQTPIQSNQWYNLVIRKEGLTYKFFVNGVLDKVSVATITPLSQTCGLNFGSAAGGEFFKGSIDDIGIWNRALTEAEILALYEGCQLAITTQPQDQSVATSVGTASFAAASSSANATYQWQTNLGLGYQNISNAGQYTGATSAALTVSNLSLSNNNQVFRCIVNDGACADTTAEATLTIIDDAGINLINEALIGVYPNPVQDILYVKGITSKEFEYEVLSIDGKLLQKGKSQGEISVKDLRKGNYVLRIGQEQVSFVKQ